MKSRHEQFYHSDSSPQERKFNQPEPQHQQGLIHLMQYFSQNLKKKQCLVSLDENFQVLDEGLIGRTFVIIGPSQSGKTTSVFWSIRDQRNTIVITIDCGLYKTEVQFIQKMVKDIGRKLQLKNIDKKIVCNENIRFGELNDLIKNGGKKIIFLIRNAERLVEYKKQILLYNLCEWFDNSEIQKHIGIVYTTRALNFIERFEKRVRSRLKSKSVLITRPNARTIIKMLSKRVQCLIAVYKSKKRSRQVIKAFEKIRDTITKNRQFETFIQNYQQNCEKDLIYFLNMMKVALGQFYSTKQIFMMSQKQLKNNLLAKIQRSFNYVLPVFEINLIRTCTIPECLVLALIYSMMLTNREPNKYKTLFQMYSEMKIEYIESQGRGFSFNLTRNTFEKSVMKLQELHIVDLECEGDSLWSSEVLCQVPQQDIRKALQGVKNLPPFIVSILNANK